MIKGACTRKQKLGVRRLVVQWLVQKYKQTHSVGKRLGQGRKCKLSSATESNMMSKSKIWQICSSDNAWLQLKQKEHCLRDNGPSGTRRKGLKYMSVTGRETLTSTQIRNKQGDTSERPNFNWENVYLSTKIPSYLELEKLKPDKTLNIENLVWNPLTPLLRSPVASMGARLQQCSDRCGERI